MLDNFADCKFILSSVPVHITSSLFAPGITGNFFSIFNASVYNFNSVDSPGARVYPEAVFTDAKFVIYDP